MDGTHGGHDHVPVVVDRPDGGNDFGCGDPDLPVQ
jgi:hypothetical protein